MAFYAHPTSLVSPGDIFPEIPVSVVVPPLRIVRKSKFTPKAKFGQQDLRRVFSLPMDAGSLGTSNLTAKAGEETIANTRVGLALFLSWGSQVEADEREVSQSGEPKRKAWLAAPIYSLLDIPEQATVRDPETDEKILIRDIVRNNLSHNYFYLPAFPNSGVRDEYYADFRKISPVAMGFFVDAKERRLATLTLESLNLLFSRLMWFFTRAEYFFHPLRCKGCGADVELDIRFEGQNSDAEAWE